MTETTASLPGLDEFQQRAYDNLRNRHAEQARKAA